MPFLDFTDETIKWYTSYLSNRKFIISMENAYSDQASIACGIPQGSILGSLLFLIYMNDMPQAVDSEVLLYADDTCLVFQHRNRKSIEEHLNGDFSSLVDWFVDNRLSVHLGEDKTKSILFSPKHRSKSIGQIDISYNDVKIKQHSKVTYLGCILDECLTRESMAMQVLPKVTSKLKFLYTKNRFLSKDLRRLLSNALIQPHFDKLQILQNKCISFCLQLDNQDQIGSEHFGKNIWLSINQRFEQCLSASAYRHYHLILIMDL